MFANASQNPLQARIRARRLRMAFVAALGGAVLAGSAAVSAQPGTGAAAQQAAVQRAASADIERSFVTYQTPTGMRTVRVIPLFKQPESAGER